MLPLAPAGSLKLLPTWWRDRCLRAIVYRAYTIARFLFKGVGFFEKRNFVLYKMTNKVLLLLLLPGWQ